MPNPFHLHVLASGSAGNAAAVIGPMGWMLIDVGLNSTDLRRRLAIAGLDQSACKGCLLTHTHGDHWHDSGIAWLASRRIPIWLHPAHLSFLETQSRAIHTLKAARLVHRFANREDFSPFRGFSVTPTQVSHDSDPTFGFRIMLSDPEDRRSNTVFLGFFSDLGIWNPRHKELLEGLDLLALEFNYDPELLDNSPRPDFLKRRIAGPKGHLSNLQAAEVVGSLLSGGRLQSLVLLHLSKECNTPEHALGEARSAARSVGTIQHVVAALQDAPTAPIPIGGNSVGATTPADADFGPLFRCLGT